MGEPTPYREMQSLARADSIVRREIKQCTSNMEHATLGFVSSVLSILEDNLKIYSRYRYKRSHNKSMHGRDDYSEHGGSGMEYYSRRRRRRRRSQSNGHRSYSRHSGRSRHSSCRGRNSDRRGRRREYRSHERPSIGSESVHGSDDYREHGGSGMEYYSRRRKRRRSQSNGCRSYSRHSGRSRHSSCRGRNSDRRGRRREYMSHERPSIGSESMHDSDDYSEHGVCDKEPYRRGRRRSQSNSHRSYKRHSGSRRHSRSRERSSGRGGHRREYKSDKRPKVGSEPFFDYGDDDCNWCGGSYIEEYSPYNRSERRRSQSDSLRSNRHGNSSRSSREQNQTFPSIRQGRKHNRDRKSSKYKSYKRPRVDSPSSLQSPPKSDANNNSGGRGKILLDHNISTRSGPSHDSTLSSFRSTYMEDSEYQGRELNLISTCNSLTHPDEGGVSDFVSSGSKDKMSSLSERHRQNSQKVQRYGNVHQTHDMTNPSKMLAEMKVARNSISLKHKKAKQGASGVNNNVVCEQNKGIDGNGTSKKRACVEDIGEMPSVSKDSTNPLEGQSSDRRDSNKHRNRSKKSKHTAKTNEDELETAKEKKRTSSSK